MPTPTEILTLAAEEARSSLHKSFIKDRDIQRNIAYVCRNTQNRAGVRLLLACVLAKIHKPDVDIRKPYTEIRTSDSFSGRFYDESYIGPFVSEYRLPCNSTTAFLTPALRNRYATLTPDLNLVGNPPLLYTTALELLTLIHEEKVGAREVLVEVLRLLFLILGEREQRMKSLLADLKASEKDQIPLSAESIITLLQQHLSSKNASRLPVLIVAAAYKAASSYLGERALPLKSHNAADLQTGAIGDVQVVLIDDNRIVTCYEMKTKRVTREDLDLAVKKASDNNQRVDNYIFITTDVIEITVKEYALSLYEKTGGIEFVVLDCIGFLRHFLHLFHRLRLAFLDAYQEFVLAEPESAVRQELKELFLSLRKVAESGTGA